MMINSDAQKNEYYGPYCPLYAMIESNDWQGVEDFVKQTKEAQSSKGNQIININKSLFYLLIQYYYFSKNK